VIVVDASVVANAVADDAADGRIARDVLASDADLCAPDFVDVETVAVLRKRWLAGSLTAQVEVFRLDSGDAGVSSGGPPQRTSIC
jgi:predicted nucleic acid-binding protein